MDTHSLFNAIVEKIIKEQEGIIGPIAVEQAGKVKGLKVNWKTHEFQFSGNESAIIEDLIEKYRDFFGEVSIEVCRHAVRNLVSQLPVDQQPRLLR